MQMVYNSLEDNFPEISSKLDEIIELELRILDKLVEITGETFV